MARETKTRETSKGGSGIRWRLWLGLAVLATVGVSSAMAGYKVRQYVFTDPQFTLSRERTDALVIQGVVYASRWKVQHVFAADFGRSVFLVPLEERRRRLMAIDWVEDASVSRIWPDRLSVHIRERQPVAFVNFRSGVLLIDAHGVLLEPPARARFAFPVLAGLAETEAEPQRLERVQSLLQFQRDMGYLMHDISEVSVADPENLRILAQVDNRAVELMMGSENFARRYQNFIAHYPEIFKRSPEVKAFDLRLDDRITAKE
jgi:cell division protein FtsQ